MKVGLFERAAEKITTNSAWRLVLITEDTDDLIIPRSDPGYLQVFWNERSGLIQ